MLACFLIFNISLKNIKITIKNNALWYYILKSLNFPGPHILLKFSLLLTAKLLWRLLMPAIPTSLFERFSSLHSCLASALCLIPNIAYSELNAFTVLEANNYFFISHRTPTLILLFEFRSIISEAYLIFLLNILRQLFIIMSKKKLIIFLLQIFLLLKEIQMNKLGCSRSRQSSVRNSQKINAKLLCNMCYYNDDRDENIYI